MDRREFTGRALMAMFAGVTVTITRLRVLKDGAAPSPR